MARIFQCGFEQMAAYDSLTPLALTDPTVALVGKALLTAAKRANSGTADVTLLAGTANSDSARVTGRDTTNKSLAGSKASWTVNDSSGGPVGGLWLTIDMAQLGNPTEFYVGFRIMANSAASSPASTGLTSLALFSASSSACVPSATAAFSSWWRACLRYSTTLGTEVSNSSSTYSFGAGYSNQNYVPGGQLFFPSTWHYVAIRFRRISSGVWGIQIKWDDNAATAEHSNPNATPADGRYLSICMPVINTATTTTNRIFGIDDIVINDTTGSVNNSWPAKDFIIGLDPSAIVDSSGASAAGGASDLIGALTGTGQAQLSLLTAYLKASLTAPSVGGGTITAVNSVAWQLQNLFKTYGADAVRIRAALGLSSVENTKGGASDSPYLWGSGQNHKVIYDTTDAGAAFSPSDLANIQLVLRNLA